MGCVYGCLFSLPLWALIFAAVFVPGAWAVVLAGLALAAAYGVATGKFRRVVETGA